MIVKIIGLYSSESTRVDESYILREFINYVYNEYKNNKLHHYVHVLQQYKFIVDNTSNKKIVSEILKYDNNFLNFIERYKQNQKVYNFLYNIYLKINIKQYDYKKSFI